MLGLIVKELFACLALNLKAGASLLNLSLVFENMQSLQLTVAVWQIKSSKYLNLNVFFVGNDSHTLNSVFAGHLNIH